MPCTVRLTASILLVAIASGLFSPKATAQFPGQPTELPEFLPESGGSWYLMFATSTLMRVTSSTTYPPAGNLFNGLAGADYQVNKAAYNAGLIDMIGWDPTNPADLRYTALLSTSEVDLIDRIPGDGPVFNTFDTRLAKSKADLFDGSLEQPVDYDEFGQYILWDPDVWTGSDAFGRVKHCTHCGDWTIATGAGGNGARGNAFVTDETWLDVFLPKSCGQTARLYGISPPRPVPIWGDYDLDGDVDYDDYLVLESTLGDFFKPWHISGGHNAYHKFGIYSDAQYLALWERYYVAVPEPAGLSIWGLFGFFAMFRRNYYCL